MNTLVLIYLLMTPETNNPELVSQQMLLLLRIFLLGGGIRLGVFLLAVVACESPKFP